jgi:hypothetical protein
MSYELRASDFHTVIFTVGDYDTMWKELMDFRDTQHDQNIDGLIVRNTLTGQWDYAWRVARQMQDIKVS